MNTIKEHALMIAFIIVAIAVLAFSVGIYHQHKNNKVCESYANSERTTLHDPSNDTCYAKVGARYYPLFEFK